MTNRHQSPLLRSIGDGRSGWPNVLSPLNGYPSLLPGSLRKIDDIQIQWKLSMTRARAGEQAAAPTPLYAVSCSWILLLRNLPRKSKAVDDVRDSIGRERRRALHEMEMQMRRRGVPAVAKLAQHITPLYVLPLDHANGALFHV